MTHPLTPREKVARAIQAHDNDHVPDGYANGLSDEVSDWSAYLADRVLTALASGSGDHAELARLAEAAKRVRRDAGGRLDGDDAYRIWFSFLDAANPATVLALLAENAALRESVSRHDRQVSGMLRARLSAEARATEAERKLAEAVGLMREWMGAWFVDADSRGESAIADDTRKFLSKEAERG